MSENRSFGQRLTLIRHRFRRWRRTRPFWGGVFALLSGLVILAPPYASLRLGDMAISVSTIGGGSALLIGAVLVICGLSFWIRPQFRLAAGVVAVLVALVAEVTANLGSFLIGTILGLVGAGLAIAWTDAPKPPAKRRTAKLDVPPPAPDTAEGQPTDAEGPAGSAPPTEVTAEIPAHRPAGIEDDPWEDAQSASSLPEQGMQSIAWRRQGSSGGDAAEWPESEPEPRPGSRWGRHSRGDRE